MRDGYAADCAPPRARLGLWHVAVLASAAAIYCHVAAYPDGISSGRGSGRLLHLGAAARRRIGCPHQRGGAGGSRACCRSMPQVQNIFAVIGFSIVDGVNEPNTGFVVPTLKPFADRAGAANSAQALIAQGVRRRTANPRCDHDPFQSAAHHRPVDHRRLRIRAGRARGPGARRDEQRDAGDHRQRQSRPTAQSRVLDLYREQSLDLSRYRPRESTSAGPQHE